MGNKKKTVVIRPEGMSKEVAAQKTAAARANYLGVRVFYSEPALSISLQLDPASSSKEVAEGASRAINQIILERHGVDANVDPEVSDWINMDGPASGDTLRDIHRRSNGQPVMMVVYPSSTSPIGEKITALKENVSCLQKRTVIVEPQLPNVAASQENEQHTVPDVLCGIEGPEDRISESVVSTDHSSKDTDLGSEREHELETKITSLIFDNQTLTLENENIRRTIKMLKQILYPLHRRVLLDAAQEKLLRKYSHAIAYNDLCPPISSEGGTSSIKKILASLDVEDRQFLDVEAIEMIIGRGRRRGIYHGSGSPEGKMIGENGSRPVLSNHLAPPQVEIYQRIHVFCYGEMAQLIV